MNTQYFQEKIADLEDEIRQLREQYAALVTEADKRLCPACDLHWSNYPCACAYQTHPVIEGRKP